MPLEETVTFHPARNSVQPYFPTDYSNQHIFPFDASDEARALIIPHTAVLLVPKDIELDYPLQIQDPASMEPEPQFDGGERR
jgi:hypothetical protein